MSIIIPGQVSVQSGEYQMEIWLEVVCLAWLWLVIYLLPDKNYLW